MEIVGRVTQDAIVKQLTDERKVVNFTVAINDYLKPKGASEGKQTTLFINCSYSVTTKVAEN